MVMDFEGLPVSKDNAEFVLYLCMLIGNFEKEDIDKVYNQLLEDQDYVEDEE